MLAYTAKGKFERLQKSKSVLQHNRDAIVTVVALYDSRRAFPCHANQLQLIIGQGVT